MQRIVKKIASWFGKQEAWELQNDQSREAAREVSESGGHHKEHMMDRIDHIADNIADDEDL